MVGSLIIVFFGAVDMSIETVHFFQKRMQNGYELIALSSDISDSLLLCWFLSEKQEEMKLCPFGQVSRVP